MSNTPTGSDPAAMIAQSGRAAVLGGALPQSIHQEGVDW